MNICICGGGNLGHVIGGYLAAREEHNVNLLTRNPERWGGTENDPLIVTDPDGHDFRAVFHTVTSDAAEAMRDMDMVLLCVPGFAIASVLNSIRPHVKKGTQIGSVFCSSGFFLIAAKMLPAGTELYGFQRVPYIARTIEYGHRARLMGYRPECNVAVRNIEDREPFRRTMQALYGMPIHILGNYLEATLTNSNPLLHPSRLYGMFGDGKECYDHHILFYGEWDVHSSEILIECDSEFQRLRESLGIPQNAVPTLLDYYESTDAVSMAKKISNIRSWSGILSPMIKTGENRYIPDYSDRYFTEDIPYGLLLIKSFAARRGITTPMIDEIICWAQGKMGKEYMVDGQLNGKNIKETIVAYA